MTAMRLRARDWILTLVFLGVGFAIGYRVLFDFHVTDFGQQWMPAAVMWACGHGLVDPVHSPAKLTAFLSMASQIPNFDCGELVSAQPAGRASAPFSSHLYLGLAVAVSWRLFGVSYLSLAPLL